MRGEALDEALFLGQHRLLPRVRRLAVRFADAALALVEIVVSRVRGDFPAESISAMRFTMRFMKSRSCDVMSSAPGSDFRKSSSQMMDSMSRWFVGSSSSRTSGRPSSTRAIATRIFHPPDNAPTSPSIRSSSKPSPCRTSRAWLSSA